MSFIMERMRDFIRVKGIERVEQIKREMETEFTIQCEKMVQEKKKAIQSKIDLDLKIAERNLIIAKSKILLKKRLDVMQLRYELMENMRFEAGVQMAEHLEKNREEYALLLKKLLVQGLIKLLESKVTLRCRKSDFDILTSIIEEAVKDYK